MSYLWLWRIEGVLRLMPAGITEHKTHGIRPPPGGVATTTTATTSSGSSGNRVVAGTETGRLGQLRRKLIDFLRRSLHYAPEKMLSKFPREELLEERAVLLSRIHQHTQVGWFGYATMTLFDLLDVVW
jgi:hypothetical protein